MIKKFLSSSKVHKSKKRMQSTIISLSLICFASSFCMESAYIESAYLHDYSPNTEGWQNLTISSTTKAKEIILLNNGYFNMVPKEIIIEIFKFILLTSCNESVLGKSISSILKLNKFFNALIKEDSLSLKIVLTDRLEWLNQIKTKFYNSKGLQFNFKMAPMPNKNTSLILSLITKIKDFIKNKDENAYECNKREVGISIRILLFEAITKGNADLVILALNKGANINRGNNYGLTALMYSARYGFKDIAEVLLANGAKINQLDNYGWSALTHAKSNNEIAQLLLNHGAEDYKKNDTQDPKALNIVLQDDHKPHLPKSTENNCLIL